METLPCSALFRVKFTSESYSNILTCLIVVLISLLEVVYDLVCKLMEKIDFSFNLSRSSKINYHLHCLDGYIGAFIVIGTKLIYGLDDEHET